MMRMLLVVIVLSGFVLASNFVDADTRGGQFSYKVDGQTLSKKVGEVRTSEKRNLPISNKGEVNIVATSQRYDGGWRYFGEICYVGEAVGYKLILQNPEWHQTITFADGSTITELLIEHTICDVPATDDRLAYGTWEIEWTVVGGSKSFEGASGSKYSSGSYQVLWNTERSTSSAYDGVMIYDLD